MFRIVLLVIGIVVLYKLIFDFIIPVYRASREIKSRFRDMHQQMGDDMNRFDQQTNQGQQRDVPKKPRDKDYIDYEEVK
jgi:hypothetical protein